MANSAQARKRARQNVTRNLRNRSYRSSIRTQIKALLSAIKVNDKKTVPDFFRVTVSMLDKGAGKGLMHKNTVARIKSRLNKRVQALVG